MKTFLTALALLAACGDDTLPTFDAGGTNPDSGVDATVPDSTTPKAARIAIGAGRIDFTAVSDSDEIELVAGSQGAFHIDIALRLFDIEPDGAILRLQGFDPVSGEALSNSIERRLTRARVRQVDDYWLRLGDQVVFDVEDPTVVTGIDVRLDVETEEADGTRTQSSVILHIVDDEE